MIRKIFIGRMFRVLLHQRDKRGKILNLSRGRIHYDIMFRNQLNSSLMSIKGLKHLRIIDLFTWM